MIKQKIEIEERYSKYEIARILGARALQLSMNAPLLLKIDKETLEKIKYDPLKIAEMELRAGILPITVKRPLPQKMYIEEDQEEEIKKDTKEEIEERKKEKKIEQEEIMEEMEIEPEEELEEENAKKEVLKEGSEITEE